MALDNLTALLARKPLDFLRAKVINPPGLDLPVQGKRTIDVNERSLRFFSKPSAIQVEALAQRFKSVETKVPIAWIRLKRDPMAPGAYTFDLESAEDAEGKDVEARIGRADLLPIYYLPWRPDRFVRMTIPAYRTENVMEFGNPKNLEPFGKQAISTKPGYPKLDVGVDPYNPHLFFTAALTGCSVFVYGDPRQPTVTHVGTQTDTPYGDDCASFWRELLLVERFQRLHHEGSAYEVNVDDYMGETGSVWAFRRWLARQPEKFTVKSITPFGSVFGIRYGSLWSFYLQESAFIDRYRVVQKTRTRVARVAQLPEFDSPPDLWYRNELVVEKVDVHEDAATTIPLSVRPFFPRGGGTARLWRTFKKVYGYC